MNATDSKLEDYLLPDAESLDEFSFFDDAAELPHEKAGIAEEWPQL